VYTNVVGVTIAARTMHQLLTTLWHL
jgi:hypothetical protein